VAVIKRFPFFRHGAVEFACSGRIPCTIPGIFSPQSIGIKSSAMLSVDDVLGASPHQGRHCPGKKKTLRHGTIASLSQRPKRIWHKGSRVAKTPFSQLGQAPPGDVVCASLTSLCCPVRGGCRVFSTSGEHTQTAELQVSPPP